MIAVDLNSEVVSRTKRIRKTRQAAKKTGLPQAYKGELFEKLSDYYETTGINFAGRINELLGRESSTPDIIETVMTSINIMQGLITRINLAVEPPDILIQPHLGQLKMLDFDQVEHTIEEGYAGVKDKIEAIKALLEPT